MLTVANPSDYDTQVAQEERAHRAVRERHLFLLGIVLLATALRFLLLDDQSLWYDEAFSVLLAKIPLPQALAFTAQDVHPPLYYLILGWWIRLFGEGEFVVRALSAMCGVATVPLVYAVGRRTLDATTSLFAALLAALSPLLIYYSRETRMYALLTSVSLLSSYLLLRITNMRAGAKLRLLLWGAYLAASLVAAYVHYMSFLVLAAHAVFFVVWWLAHGHPRDLGKEAVGVGALWAVGYSLWLPRLVDHYLHFTGYWQGSMHPLQTLQRVFAGFTLGETIGSPAGPVLVSGHVVLLCVGLALILPALRKSKSPLSAWSSFFLATYLLVPLLMLCVLYYYKPKVSARYSMVFFPAFLLLISGSITVMWRQRSDRTRHLVSVLWRGSAVISACLVLGVACCADGDLLFAPEMRRPDFRGAVRYVCHECAEDETIVLIAGHMFPVFDYYCNGRERHPLPDDPVLRIDDMIGLQVTEGLQEIASGKKGVWVLRWQHRIVDPQDTVSTLLLSQGTEMPVPRSFPGIGIRHFLLSPDASFVWDTSLKLPAGARWEHDISLIEARLNDDTFQPGDDLQLTLFWRADQPVDQSYTVFAHVVNQRGTVWAQHDGYPASATRQTNTWEAGETVEDRHRIPIQEHVPSGEYDLVIGIYLNDGHTLPRLPILDEVGNAQQDSLTLAKVQVVQE